MKGTEQMTAVSKETAGAVNRDTIDWNSIDWPRHERIVNRLQARIVKAVKADVLKPRTQSHHHRARPHQAARLKHTSRVPGNLHARFLKVGPAVTPLPYLAAWSRRPASLVVGRRRPYRQRLLALTVSYAYGAAYHGIRFHHRRAPNRHSPSTQKSISGVTDPGSW